MVSASQINRIVIMALLPTAMAVSGCSTVKSSFLRDIPYVGEMSFFNEEPPLHTFDLPKGSEFFDANYIGQPERGKVFYQQKDYATALHEFYGSARNGNDESQFYMGLMFARGEGVPRDTTQAQYWFDRAARKGNAEAQQAFAAMLWQGNYLETNRQTALEWYQRAAENGQVDAQFFLGRLYLNGYSDDTLKSPIKQDQALAFEWMQKAARKGYSAAQHNLALMYQYGAGTQVDLAQAFYWFKNATLVEEPNSAYDFSRFYLINSSPYYDQQRALYWLKKAALAGHAIANQKLAALQKQVDIGSESLVLFGAPLSLQLRQELRRTLQNQGGVTLVEKDDGWYDSYDSKDIWTLSDRLFIGYTLETNKVALVQYRLPSADTPKTLAEVRTLLEGRYGKPISKGERVFTDGIYNEWKVKDTRIILSRGDAHALFLSYYIEPAFTQLSLEQLQHNPQTLAGKALINVY